MPYAIGFDIGSVSLNCVVLDREGHVVHEAPYRRHFGRARVAVRELLEWSVGRFGAREVHSVTFTGTLGEPLARESGLPFEPETVAQVIGAVRVAPQVRTLVVMGGQDAALFRIGHGDAGWRLESFALNGPCAAGTGSFIDQQAERLATALFSDTGAADQRRLEEVLRAFIEEGMRSTRPAPVACRCTVFTKSDMIHLQNKGEPLADIIAGLHHGNAANFVSTLAGTRPLEPPVVFAGGVASNPLQLAAFRRYWPEVEVPPHHTSLGAIGAALESVRRDRRTALEPAFLEGFARAGVGWAPEAAPRLSLALTEFHAASPLPPWQPAGGDEAGAWLGVDVGSTSTKHALVDGRGRVVHTCYLPTRGRPIDVVRQLLARLREDLGDGVRIAGVATTGSGRQVAGDFLDADLVLDEITAHARGAVAVDPDVDTIFEIGGQDSKYIGLEGGHPLDFDMNKVCAAGTGSFLQELAGKLGIGIVGEFEEAALAAPSPAPLAERCTVFMESDLFHALAQGARREDVIAGLAYAVVRNYLNRVVGTRRVGRRVMFLGGPSLNRAVVAAFERVLGRALVVPPHREVMGAYGAALALRDGVARKGRAAPARRLGEIGGAEPRLTERVCSADPSCHNECKLRVYDFGARKSVWGGECGRYEAASRGGRRATNWFAERRRRFEEALEGRAEAPRPAGVSAGAPSHGTVGVPLALHALGWGVFWTHVLSELGYRVILSPPTDAATARLGVESVSAETCFPVKVFHGHARALLDHAQLLFLPVVIDMPTPTASERGLFCPYVAGAHYMARAALGIPEGRLLRPVMRLREGPDAAAEAIAAALPGGRRPPARRMRALVRRAWEREERFRAGCVEAGETRLREVPPGEPVWVVSGRPYNLHDERCNLQIGRHLAALGIEALPMDFLDVDGEDLSDFPRMYWGLGSRILRTARRVGRTPGLFGVHLTNFGCGADSFLEHFVRHAGGGKPYLILELDEHSAVAGLLTRLEAFRNVARNVRELGPACRTAGPC